MTDQTKDNALEVVLAMLESWDRFDWAAVLDLMSPDCVWHTVMTDPATPPIVGREAIAAHIAVIAEGLESMRCETIGAAAAGEVVFVERMDAFDFKGNHGDVPVVGAFRVHDGLVHEWREYFDQQSLLQRMGVNP